MNEPKLCGRCSKPKKDAAEAGEEVCRCGRPLKFKSVEELGIAINLYFDDCDKEYGTRKWAHDEIVDGQCQNCFAKAETKGCMLISGEMKRKRPYTITGLALALDTSRETILDYEEKDEFSDTVRRAKLKIHNFGEECLFDPKVPTNGVKFSLANNYAWKEKSETTVKLKKDGAAELAAQLTGANEGES
jgi:hypothetical protein